MLPSPLPQLLPHSTKQRFKNFAITCILNLNQIFYRIFIFIIYDKILRCLSEADAIGCSRSSDQISEPFTYLSPYFVYLLSTKLNDQLICNGNLIFIVFFVLRKKKENCWKRKTLEKDEEERRQKSSQLRCDVHRSGMNETVS